MCTCECLVTSREHDGTYFGVFFAFLEGIVEFDEESTGQSVEGLGSVESDCNC